MFWYSSIRSDYCVFSSTNSFYSFPRMLADLIFFSESDFYSNSIALILLQFSAVLSSFKCLSFFPSFFISICVCVSLLFFTYFILSKLNIFNILLTQCSGRWLLSCIGRQQRKKLDFRFCRMFGQNPFKYVLYFIFKIYRIEFFFVQ